MTKRETYITYASYFAFIFALTFFGPYHGWIYGLIFSISVTLSLWLVMTFVSAAPLEEAERNSTMLTASSGTTKAPSKCKKEDTSPGRGGG
jgi:hypothetical protein